MSRPTPVDHGWAWMVMVAAFLCVFLSSIVIVNGIFQIIFMEVFNKDMFTTSWVISISTCLPAIAGPLSSYSSHLIGSRLTVILGGLVGAAGYVGAAFSQTFPQLLVSFGILTGLGPGLTFSTSFVMVGKYFEKYRNVAFGVINAGAGTGTLIMAPLVTLANEHYGWRGTMLLLGGCMLQLCWIGCLLRPISATEETGVELEIEQNGNIPIEHNDETHENPKIQNVNYEQDAHFAKMIKQRESSSGPTINSALLRKTPSGNCADNLKSQICKTENGLSKKPMMRGLDKEEEANSSLTLNTLESGLSRAGGTEPNSRASCHNSLCTTRFVLLCPVVCLQTMAIGIAFSHFPEYVKSHGTSPAGISHLLMIMGISNIVSRLLTGLASNSKDLDNMLVFMACAGITGLSFICLPLMVHTYSGQMLFSFWFGFYVNVVICLQAPLVVQIVGIKRMSAAYGVLLYLCGLGYLIGPPISGFLFDYTHDLKISFILSGLVLLFGSFLMALSVLGGARNSRPHQENTGTK